MLADLLERITELAVKAAKSDVHYPSNAPLHVQISDPEGDVELKRIEPAPLGGFLSTLDDVATVYTSKALAHDPVVYYDGATVVVICNQEDRHERYYLALCESDRFRELLAVHKAGGRRLTQKDAIKWLRLFGAADHQSLIKRLRNVDFHRHSDGKSTVEHGRESLGRAVEAAVQNADEIPDFFELRTPVYLTVGASHIETIKLALDIDLEDERFVFSVLPDEIPRARIRAEETLGAALRGLLGDDATIINGTPAPSPALNIDV